MAEIRTVVVAVTRALSSVPFHTSLSYDEIYASARGLPTKEIDTVLEILIGSGAVALSAQGLLQWAGTPPPPPPPPEVALLQMEDRQLMRLERQLEQDVQRVRSGISVSTTALREYLVGGTGVVVGVPEGSKWSEEGESNGGDNVTTAGALVMGPGQVLRIVPPSASVVIPIEIL